MTLDQSSDTKRDEQIAELARGLAHEIKNPLSTVSINLQLLSEECRVAGGDFAERAIEKIGRIQQETGRLGEIVDDFLRYARPQEPHFSKQNLILIVQEVLEFLGPASAPQGIRILMAFEEDDLFAMVDRDLIKQVFLNILLNAIDAMPDGGDLLLRAAKLDGMAQIDIADTGEGISEDRIGKIFDVYYSNKKGGTGLGLPTARKIVGLHGGTIDVESDPDKGTNFRITLPAVD